MIRTTVALAIWAGTLSRAHAFVPLLRSKTATTSLRSSKNEFFFATASEQPKTVDATSTVTDTATSNTKGFKERRALGSQELLMLPRQYKPSSETFPQMNHVSSAVLSRTPPLEHLEKAVQDAMDAHPLLRAQVEGDGEPEKRVDMLQMVRKGDPNPCTFVASDEASFVPSDVIQVVSVPGSTRADLDCSWQESFARNLDDGSWCDPHKGPLWKLEFHKLESGARDNPCALVFAFNHAMSDQSSANRLLDQILQSLAALEAGEAPPKFTKQAMPVAVEDSVLGLNQRWSDVGPGGVGPGTISYVAGKAAEGFKSPVILPEGSKSNQQSSSSLGAMTIISGNAAGGKDLESKKRKSLVQFRRVSKETMDALLEKCREKGISMSHALTAAATLTATDFMNSTRKKKRNYKILHSLDMRRFGAQIDRGNTFACMAGSHDLIHGPLSDLSGEAIRKNPTAKHLDQFWEIALQGRDQTTNFFDTRGPQEAVRVFDFAMTISDLNNLVHLTAQSKDTLGRAYSVGVTNVGVYERQKSFKRQSKSEQSLETSHGNYVIEDLFFATTHIRSGCLYPMSCLTLNGELRLTFHPIFPIVSNETNEKYADAFTELLETVAGTRRVEIKPEVGIPSWVKDDALPLATLGLGLAAVLSHAPAWSSFFSSLAEMKKNVPDEDFWPALNFWVFFAVGHPILQPILAISDVLHGTPGPMIGGLVPVLFVAMNVVAIGAFALSDQVRKAVNIAAVSAFFAYVGMGLDGTAGLGDYNLALDDSYKGEIVKGCPAYEDVRQPSMDGFDLTRYEGLWYEMKFHDWTQFKEVYDTTLKIKLTDGGTGWVDDFAVKGPAPDSAPLSWDKSPVANGAHYFLFGRVDKNDPPGILREKGFGVEFPNYIVDVKKDPVTGEYLEAIQFQCLERGGVRVFEGINFMSRKPTMSDEEMQAMHERARQAGMYPYGADPEQMHTVARRPEGAPELDNNWQAMWRAIGFDKLLELLTESIEDGGRS